ncbi:hypothetical protein HDU91_001283, partial [Kappamyces sp. JEL0680]
NDYFTFTTSQYRLSYYEVPTLKMVVFSNPELRDAEAVLQRVYEIYVEFVSKNPLIPFDKPIDNDLFRSNLLKYIRTL